MARDGVRTFTLAGSAITVLSNDVPALDWLAEFLSPPFGVIDSREGRILVRLTVDGVRHEEMARAYAARGSHREEVFFRLDQGLVTLPVFRDPAHEGVAFDAKYDCFYVLAADGVDVIGHPRARDYRSGTMRIVREIATARALASGAHLLHAAGLVLAGAAVLIAGPKGAGKSTLLCQLAATPGAALLANDRVLVHVAASLTACGMPTVVGLRPQTLAMFPRIAADLPAVRRPSALTLAESVRGAGAPALGRTQPVRISPAQLAFGLGVPRAGVAPLRALLFPVRDGATAPCSDVDGPPVRRLSVREARTALAAARFGTDASAARTIFERRFGGPGGGLAGDLDAFEDALARRVPCHRVRAGVAEPGALAIAAGGSAA